ncbi:MAG: glycosyltransferase family 2 protein [Chlorobiaceae bacterium]|nr:glycosyltransferase family 2 protein [Chlorobiaceae bacterium]NTW74998.1 glycosyltransferase family 2 protein [Chlorobiaceae bacterium]
MIVTGNAHVSVVLATFNRAGILREAIESVIDQSFRDWELIVVDDGSVDETFSMVDPYLHRHGNIRYMKHRNRKAALSRNMGIQASLGRFITFLDSDDRYLPEHLSSRVELLNSMPDVDLLTGGFACLGDPWIRDRNDPETLVHISECILCGTLFGRRELFMEIGGFREIDYAEDTDLWERAALRHKVLKIDSPESYIYQRSEDSITRTYRKNDP